MNTLRAWEIGLVVGVAFGFFVRGSVVQAPSLEPRAPGATTAPVRLATADDPSENEVRLGPSYAGQTLVDLSLAERDLRYADFRGATLRAVNFAGALLNGARFEGATFDRFCRWPVDFDPTLHGATQNDWPRP